jgi:hypothetical protein
MDSIVHQLLTRLNMFLMQELDFQVDVLRYGSEPEYAAQVLDLAMETGHDEICQLARQIRERQLQLFSLNAAPSVPAKDTTAPPPPASGSNVTGLPKSS